MRTIPIYTIFGGRVVRGARITENMEIVLGEEGRGRKLTVVPLPKDSEIIVVDGIKQVFSVPTTRDKVVAALVIRDHSGYRGTWELVETPIDLCYDYDKPINGKCEVCDGVNEHELFPSDPIDPRVIGVLIGEGRCAQGAAGNMGGGPEYLILAFPGSFSIKRYGRLYGMASRLTVEVAVDGSVKIYNSAQTIESKKLATLW